MLQKAIEFATLHHKNQWRKHSNLPYIVHPIEVMKMVAQWGVDNQDVLIAAILHDLIEDTDVIWQDIEKEFNDNVAQIVVELTHYEDLYDSKQQYLESFANKEDNVVIIKVADRICNIKDFFIDNPKYVLKYLQQSESLFDTQRTRFLMAKKEIGIKSQNYKIWKQSMFDYDDLTREI